MVEVFFYFKKIFLKFFPTVQHGDQVIITCIHFFAHPLFCCNMSAQPLL